MSSHTLNRFTLSSILLLMNLWAVQSPARATMMPPLHSDHSLQPSLLIAQPTQPAARGQCRSLRKAAFIYRGRSFESGTLMRLDPDQVVTLAENTPVNGFIAIDNPEVGYIQAANLKPCNSTTPGNGSGVGLCRKIAAKEGLEIWMQPNSKDFLARLPYKSLVYLTEPPVVRQDTGDRIWVKLASPVPGWAIGSMKGITVLTPCT
ncbi:hypothetical protein [Leptolyngbya sp. 'hensonii']|uniref:hypothetical protein n=1 Tax=Leptolyngbya sp. 'hensonii' TaxID=1922337 RepID=UPI000AFBB24D|nr:hypothetical protein [Leptolyngbya sp. 'hensonii']